ncbi:MAG: transposase [Chloroflexaceae bacterium]
MKTRQILTKYDPYKHHRCSIRLKGYDYTQAGAYFVTICTQDRACLFGEVVDGEMRLNDAGQIVQTAWDELPNHYPNVELDEFVVMPNHVHRIIVIVGAGAVGAGAVGASAVGAGLKPAPTIPVKRHGLAEIVRALKTFSARRINETRRTPGVPVWQRNYYEHIIRDDDSLDRIRQYILDNPLRWLEDREHPDAAEPDPKEAWQV